MFQSKIAIKLSFNFAMALLIFSVIIGSVFVVLFRNHTLNIHKAELENNASIIANTLSEYLDGSAKGGFAGGGTMGGYGAYMRFIGDIAGTDVWVVDEDLNLLTVGKGQGQMGRPYNYADLPQNAEQIIIEVFTGQTVFSEGFSDLLSEPTLTVGMPIKSSADTVIGVVLLHSPVHGTDDAIAQGITILFSSILVALLVSFLLLILFSNSFTKPLSKMKNTALKLANGEYIAKNNITQKDEIGELACTLDVLADRLYDASCESAKLEQMRKDFVANISHELKTPVTVIRGSLEALVEKVVTDPAKVEEYQLQMLSEAKFLQRLIGELLDLSKLQNTDFVIEKSEISICDVVDDIVRSAAHLAQKKGVTISTDKKSDHCIICGDYGRLRQMLLIVLDNAIKFSPLNGTIEVILKEQELSIKDNGTGIEAEHLPYIFDRFYKSRSEQNKAGTGLGLAIAKQIADRHNIKITVQSKIGDGAKFTFLF